jgi:hypothetical protein
MTVASTALSVYGQYQQKKAADSAADAQNAYAQRRAEVHRVNADDQRYLAEQELEDSKEEAHRERVKTAQRVSQIQAGQASSGFQLTSGAFQDVVSTERRAGGQNVESILKSGGRAFQKRAIASRNETFQANITSAEGHETAFQKKSANRTKFLTGVTSTVVKNGWRAYNA